MASEQGRSFWHTLREQASTWMGTPHQLSLTYAGLSDVGRTRSENQDCWGVFPRDERSHSEPKGQLFVIADGMGGHSRGGEASKIAVHYVPEVYFADPEESIESSLRRAFETANARIVERWQDGGLFERMGTTCSALVLTDDSVTICHVGDSRIYRVRKGEIVQLTEDHTHVAELKRRGLITEDEAKVNPRRSELLRAVGVENELEVDIVAEPAMRAGDVFVLCTDGLAEVTTDEIMRIVLEKEPEQACRELIDLENSRGGNDNITVQVIRVEAAAKSAVAAGEPVAADQLSVPAAAFALLLLVAVAAGGFYYRAEIGEKMLSLMFSEPSGQPSTQASVAGTETQGRSDSLSAWLNAAAGEMQSDSSLALPDSAGPPNPDSEAKNVASSVPERRDLSPPVVIRNRATSRRTANSVPVRSRDVTTPNDVATQSAFADFSGWQFPGLVPQRDYAVSPAGLEVKETVGVKKAIFGDDLTDFDFDVTIPDAHKLRKGQFGLFVGYERERDAENYLEVHLRRDGHFVLVRHFRNKRELLSEFDLAVDWLRPGPLHLRLRCSGTWLTVYANGKIVNAWQNGNRRIAGKVGLLVGSEVAATFSDVRVAPVGAQALK